jgi:hypothetical protein
MLSKMWNGSNAGAENEEFGLLRVLCMAKAQKLVQTTSVLPASGKLVHSASNAMAASDLNRREQR